MNAITELRSDLDIIAKAVRALEQRLTDFATPQAATTEYVMRIRTALDELLVPPPVPDGDDPTPSQFDRLAAEVAELEASNGLLHAENDELRSKLTPPPA